MVTRRVVAAVLISIFSHWALAKDAWTDCVSKMKALGMQPDKNELLKTKVTGKGDKLFVSGPIDQKMASQFFDQVITGKYKTVVFNTSGGDIAEGTSIALEIKRRHMNTEIADNGICNSICTGMFQAGSIRTMGKKSILGYHNANVAGQKTLSIGATFAGSQILQLWGLSSQLHDKIMATPADSLYCIDSAEAARYNATSTQGMLDGVDSSSGVKIIGPSSARP